ncbi:MAG TPA: FAD-binding oxidoreductase [Acidocella sp.]|nr:FAD-binding oxidoreductase [Acidocella sp.]HQU04200.1 FAD-binding oxidoreductase [Acidocella sp.]
MEVIAQLQAALGAKAVLTDAADKAAFETDWRRIHSHAALCVVFPETTEQVAAAMRIAAAAGVQLVPQGGNTGLVAGAVPVAGHPQIILNLRRMNKIRALDATGDTITVEAGVTLQTVQEEAAKAGRLFPVSLAAEGTAQIGGVISTNAGGIQVLAYGSMRAQVLGLEVVLADGRVWDGLRVLRKDNTGFDLKQFFIGAEGTLGIITAAVLRLHPAVSAHATAMVGVPSIEAALDVFKAMQAKAGSSLTACEFITADAMALGLAHSPTSRLPFSAENYVLVEISAHSAGEAVEDMLLAGLEPLLENATASDAVVAQSERERADLWRIREALSDGELAAGGSVKHDISVPIGDIPAMVRATEALIEAKFPGFRLNIFGHIGDGNLHINVRPPAGKSLADISDYKAAITAAVEGLAMLHAGSFSAEHGIGQMRIVGMSAHKSAVELDLMRSIKQALDPHARLSPGKMLPGL